jgi:E3 ubiquitin-protein ligase HERC2
MIVLVSIIRCAYTGKLGHGSEENVTTPTIISSLRNLGVRIVNISAGCEHSAVISEEGKLYTWGHGDGGRLGHGDSEPHSSPTLVTALEDMHVRYYYCYYICML